MTAWNDVACDAATGVVTYQTFYRPEAGDRVLQARSCIAFPAKEEVAAAIAEAGLAVDRWLGDWQGAPCTPASCEIIPLGCLA
ncbi:hypothetical protein [Mesorhizobium sp. SP-1A]|uniref:hypothetical protein n=1 Tax=Mesorhizobium sp. SP-1A TaxID=3077840 RepID=UPI0028F6F6EB|nr:hypothetical protein [Mesorhizobium sp. SP-1A]